MLYKQEENVNFMVVRHTTTAWWNHLISHPNVVKQKADSGLAIFGKPTKQVILNERGYMRCIKENIEEIYALPVDVDNGTTMESFERDFQKYSYQLYTTYSWRNGKPGDRFRVFFPLREPIKVNWLVPPVKEKLMNLFDMADKSCFDKAHWQCLPCVAHKEADYRYVQHHGELLSFAYEDFGKMANEYAEDFHWKKEIAEADRDNSKNHDGALKHAQAVFDSTMEGSRDRTVYSILKWLHNDVGCAFDEVISLRAPRGFDDEYVKKVNREYGYR